MCDLPTQHKHNVIQQQTKTTPMMTAKNMFTAMVSAISISISANAAEVGKAAPDFSAKDAKGVDVSLSALKGKVVVLEWVNHECPFVVKHYGSKNMQKLQQTYTAKGVVWITINSGSKASGSYTDDATFIKMSEEKGSKASHLIGDESGAIGKAYDAKVCLPTMVQSILKNRPIPLILPVLRTTLRKLWMPCWLISLWKLRKPNPMAAV